MPPKKVKDVYITDESKRKSTFRKRKDGMKKKIDEISTLCGIEACAIIYNQDDPEPKVFPSEGKAKSVLDRFMAMSEVEKNKNMLDQEGYLNQRILKALKKVENQKDANKKKEMTNFIHQLMNCTQNADNASWSDLQYLMSLIDENLMEVDEKIKMMKSKEVGQSSGSIPEPTVPPFEVPPIQQGD